jgi:hypothetical protein
MIEDDARSEATAVLHLPEQSRANPRLGGGQAMMPASDHSQPDKTAPERRKKLSKKQIRDLELAGGVEGGMRAGSAGGSGESDADAKADQSPTSDDRR